MLFKNIENLYSTEENYGDFFLSMQVRNEGCDASTTATSITFVDNCAYYVAFPRNIEDDWTDIERVKYIP